MSIRNWHAWKKWAAAGLALVIVADIALVVFLWKSSLQGPKEMRAERDRVAIQARLLRADVARGERIRASLPEAGRQCDVFYRESFLDGSTGYSRVESDLGAIAAQAGVKTSGLIFKQKDIPERGVTQISITTGLDGDYPAIIQFINGLERSKNFYLLDSLHLGSGNTGGLRLELDLHTFFRT